MDPNLDIELLLELCEPLLSPDVRARGAGALGAHEVVEGFLLGEETDQVVLVCCVHGSCLDLGGV